MGVMAPGQGTGFVSVGDFLDANQGTLTNEAAQIGSGVGESIDAARGAADSFWKSAAPASGPWLDSSQTITGQVATTTGDKNDFTTQPGYGDALDKAIAAKDQTAALGSPGGLSDYFQKHMGDSRDQGDFDASLLGSSSRLDVAGLQNRANGLIDYLNTPQAPVAPAAPPPQTNQNPYKTEAGGYPHGQPYPDEPRPTKPYPYTPTPGGPKPRQPGVPY